MSLLLSHGAQVDRLTGKQEYVRTPTLRGLLVRIPLYLERPIIMTPHVHVLYYRSSLHMAVVQGHSTTAEQLLRGGADRDRPLQGTGDW